MCTILKVSLAYHLAEDQRPQLLSSRGTTRTVNATKVGQEKTGASTGFRPTDVSPCWLTCWAGTTKDSTTSAISLLRDCACRELSDPADVGHPALFRVSRLPMSNNEESDEDPDQRSYQDELVHKTALFMFCSEESGTLRAGTSGVQTG